MNDQAICVGGCYAQDECMLHVIAMRDEYALLEQKSRNEIVQYIVTNRLFLEENRELHWRGSGRYYPVDRSEGKTEFNALKEAWDDFSDRDTVHVLMIEDSLNGSQVRVHRTHDLAMAALQCELDKHHFIQKIADTIGLSPLKAEKYIECSYFFSEALEAYQSDVFYRVEEMPICNMLA